MGSSQNTSASRSSSAPISPPPPPSIPTNDDIEAVIQMATSGRPSPDGWSGPVRDTRTQLFVGNLPYRVRWQDLKDLFRKAGIVLRADVSLGPDNRSRGYGTVLLASAEDAQRAVEMFNGYLWQSRTLEVRPDRLPPDFDNPGGNSLAPPGSAGPSTSTFSVPPHIDSHTLGLSGNSESLDQFPLYGPVRELGSSPTAVCRNLFVGNLPFHCQWQDLKDLFRQAGTILRADVALSQDGRSRGFGTVVFATESDAERAVKMFNGYEYNGRSLKVHYDKFSQAPQSPSGTASFTSSAIYTVGANKSASGNTFTSSVTSQLQITLPPGYLLDYGPSSPGSPLNSYKPALPPQSRLAQVQALQQNNTRPFQQPVTSHDVDGLTSSFVSTHIFKPPPPIMKPQNNTGTPPISPPASSAQQVESRQRQPPPSLQNHPRHPGPIVLPPPPPITSFAQLQAHHGLSLSPLHPAGMSPLRHPMQPLVPVTPHGLPPITPSMPPFTMIPMSPIPAGPETEPMYQYVHPMPEVPPQPYLHQAPLYSPPLPPSPSMHILPPHARPLLHHVNSFSPGIAMSPGAFWGRPGASGPNPHAAVGAPLRNVAYMQMREPKEYFDPGYFPPMPSGPPGTIPEEREGEDQGDSSQMQLSDQGWFNEEQDQQNREANQQDMGEGQRNRVEDGSRDSEPRTAGNSRSLSRERSRGDQPERESDREPRSPPFSRNIFYQTSGMTVDSWRANVGAVTAHSSVDGGSERERTHLRQLSRDLHNGSRGPGEGAGVGIGLGIVGASTVSLGERSAATSISGGEDSQEPGSRMRSPWTSTSPWGGSER